MKKKVVIGVVFLPCIILFVITMFLSKRPSYEDFNNPTEIPKDIVIPSKDGVSDGFYEVGSDDEESAKDALSAANEEQLREFLGRSEQAIVSYSGEGLDFNVDEYSDSVQFLCTGTVGNINSLIRCIDVLSFNMGIDKVSIEVSGDAVSDEEGDYYEIFIGSDYWRVYYFSSSNTNYGYVMPVEK